MSDPVKNHELEDVLSSIRRLVSEDGYGGSTPEKTDDIPTDVAEVAIGRKRPEVMSADKLVLTEAFLVSESETTEMPETDIETLVLDQHHSVDDDERAEDTADVLVLNSVFDDLAHDANGENPEEVAVDETPQDDALFDVAMPEHDEPETTAEPETAAQDDEETETSDFDQEDAAPDLAQEQHHESDDQAPSEPVAEDHIDETLSPAPVEARDDEPPQEHHDDLSEDVTPEAVPVDIAEASQDDFEPAEHEEADATPEAFQINPSDQIEDVEDAITIETRDEDDAAPQDGFSEHIGLAHTVAELEAVISAQNDDWEPDGSEEEGASPEIEPLEWRSESTRGAKVFEMPRADAPAAVPGFQGETELDDDIDFGLEDFSDDDAPLLDEAALRDMVSDIVRQELQGPLGERITRNVRKLVRREIHRILASEDFD